jgi:predicted amidohydrolase YtcJ
MQNMSLLDAGNYVRALERSKLPLRVRVIRFPGTDAGARDLKEGRTPPKQSRTDSRVTVTGTKWLLDGTSLERRAALRTAYRDCEGWAGQLYLPEEEMQAILRESVENDDPLLVHAVGDKTVELFLKAWNRRQGTLSGEAGA